MNLSTELANRLDDALGAARHHAYLFISPSFAGERTEPALVALLLQKLAGLSLPVSQEGDQESNFWDAFNRHPDLLRADPERSILRKEDVEVFRERTMYAATFARRRFLLIERAERLNNQSANALLKTLEEPLAECVFVLTTARPAQLPATIPSRCQKILLPRWDGPAGNAADVLDPEDRGFIESFFAGEHLKMPPRILPPESLHTPAKFNLPAKTVSDITQWSDSAGRRYSAQLLRDVVVEKTSDALKSGRLSQTRATLLLSEINRWSETDPYNPTNAFWLARILLTLAN